MTTPSLFPGIPVTDADRRKLAFGNAHVARAWIKANPAAIAKLKAAIIIEVERGPGIRHVAVLEPLLAALQRAERRQVDKVIGEYLKKHKWTYADFYFEIPLKMTRRQHCCHWCAEVIERRQPRVRVIARREGDSWSGLFHPECAAARKQWFPRYPKGEQPPEEGTMQRGSVQPKQECSE